MTKKNLLKKEDLKFVAWDELDDKMKEKARKTDFTCLLCGETYTGLGHQCGSEQATQEPSK